VIGHKGICVNPTFILNRCVAKGSQIEFIIVGMKEHCLTIDSTLDYVLRDAGNEIAGLTRHGFLGSDIVPPNVITTDRFNPAEKLRFDPSFARFGAVRVKPRFDPGFWVRSKIEVGA